MPDLHCIPQCYWRGKWRRSTIVSWRRTVGGCGCKVTLPSYTTRDPPGRTVLSASTTFSGEHTLFWGKRNKKMIQICFAAFLSFTLKPWQLSVFQAEWPFFLCQKFLHFSKNLKLQSTCLVYSMTWPNFILSHCEPLMANDKCQAWVAEPNFLCSIVRMYFGKQARLLQCVDLSLHV